MRVAIVINSKAGSVNEALIREQIQEALFRCDLRFLTASGLQEVEDFAAEEIGRSDYIMICGGDGTINVTLQALMRQSLGRELPPICVVRSGTANDLALEIGVSHRVEKAARTILEGVVKKIDLIELECDKGNKAYMLTNGGVGIPALIAEAANQVRSHVRHWASDGVSSRLLRFAAVQSQRLLKKSGPGIYTMMVAEALRRWSPDDWEIEVEMPGRRFTTKAPSILISNQPRMGQNMTTAPYTSNDDGLVNVLVTEANTLKDQVRAVLSLRQGNPELVTMNRAFEVPELRLKSRSPLRSLTFFGDGEILLKDAQEITVRCRHQSLPVVVRHS